MKKIFYVVCFILVVMVFSAVSDAQESQTLDKDALQAMLALNYCHMSLVKILAYEDRVVLDEEYNNIINNINLTAIQDEEIIIVLQNLMDTLTAYKLAEGDKNILVKEYNKRVAEASYATFNLAFKDVATDEDVKKFAIDAMTTLPKKLFKNVLNNALEGLTKGGLIGGGAGLIRGIFLTSSSGPGIGFLTMDSLASMGSSYQHYRSNIEDYRDKLDRDIWQLEKAIIQTVNETRKTFLQVYWKLMQKYNIPDEWRLTEKQLQQAVGVFKEQDLEKKLRLLKTMEQDFSVFPPFWYEFAQTFQKVGEIEQALRIYEKVEQEHIPFFREDHEFSSALMNKVVLVQAIQKTQPELLDRLELTVDIPKDLNLITANSPDDWRKNLFVALQYTELKEYETARALLMKNIDTNQEVSLNSRLLGEIYALSNDEERLTQLITKMCHDDDIRYQDTLYLIGMARDGKLLQETMDTFVKPSFSEIQFDVESQYLGLGKDTIRISIPAIWLRDDPEDFIPSLKFLEEEEDFSPAEKAQNDKEKNVQFVFKHIINKDRFIEKREQKTMVVKLTDIAQSVVLLLDVNVKDVEVEDTLLDKPGKVVGKTTKYVKNVFSKDKDTDTEKTEETQVKTKSVIDFTIKEIATAAGVCYRLDDGELERLTECSSQVEM